MYDMARPVFSDKDADIFYSLIQSPDFSTVYISENVDCEKYARTLLKKFNLSMRQESIERLGRFIARCIKANKRNIGHLTEAASIIYRRKLLIDHAGNSMKRHAEEMKRLVEENKFVRGDAFDELSPQAKAFKGKIKIIGTKAFKVAWFQAVKYRPDIIYTDEEGVKARIEAYYGKPVFHVDQKTFEFLKRQLAFPDGFYEFLEYMWFLIEAQRKRVDQGFVADRTIFLVTTANNLNEINTNNNLLAINTYGHDRPTYKGLPEFMTPYDQKQEQEKASQSPAMQKT